MQNAGVGCHAVWPAQKAPVEPDCANVAAAVGMLEQLLGKLQESHASFYEEVDGSVKGIKRKLADIRRNIDEAADLEQKLRESAQETSHRFRRAVDDLQHESNDSSRAVDTRGKRIRR
ncbi:hypothetical protein DIPPA_33207 [Diplonema papillatum]|nr:hypothetical protein DIPPA_33207 [Diplonema papillatum]